MPACTSRSPVFSSASAQGSFHSRRRRALCSFCADFTVCASMSGQCRRKRPMDHRGAARSACRRPLPQPFPMLRPPAGAKRMAWPLQGFDLRSNGQITVDGQDFRCPVANELRANFGVVPQETTLLSGTSYENLALADPHASFQDVMQACKLAENHDTIEQLPQSARAKPARMALACPAGRSSAPPSPEHCSSGPRCRSSTRRRTT